MNLFSKLFKSRDKSQNQDEARSGGCQVPDVGVNCSATISFFPITRQL